MSSQMSSQSSAGCPICQLKNFDIGPIPIVMAFAFENGVQTRLGFFGDAKNLHADVRQNLAQIIFDVAVDNESLVNVGDKYVKDTCRILLKIKIKNIIEDEQTKVVFYKFQITLKTEADLPAC